MNKLLFIGVLAVLGIILAITRNDPETFYVMVILAIIFAFI